MSLLNSMPSATEHAPYYGKYLAATAATLAAMPQPDVRALLRAQMPALRALVRDVDPATAQRSYEPGKWSLLESLVHVADTERVFAYRALRMARGDTTPLPGFEQDEWVPNSGANGRTLADILTELDAVRLATMAFVDSLDDAAIERMGTASGNPVSVRALVWMIAGHFAHHLELTRTRYLGGA